MPQPTLRQQQFTEYAKLKYRVDTGSGDRITEKKGDTDIRVFLQNPNGVMGKDTYLDDRRALLSLKEWEVDVIALPETNKNWKLEWLRSKWSSEVRRIWRHAKVYTSSISEPIDKRATFIQGGVSIIVTNKWSSRVITHGADSLGRWVWVTMRGRQQQKITLVTMYRPNPGSVADGATIVWS